MPSINLNIKQITGYDVKNFPTIRKTIESSKRVKDSDGSWKIISWTEEVEYVTLFRDNTGEKDLDIIKFGYVCEPKGHDYPIYLKMNGSWKENMPFTIFRRGIYEMQQEEWKDVNEEEEQRKTNIIIQNIRVPKYLKFTVDYILAIN